MSRLKLFRSGVGVLSLLFIPVALYAQCPLCYRAAASAGGRFIQALRDGILILLPAPFVLGAMVAYMAYRRRNSYAEDAPHSGAKIASHSAD